MVLHKTRMLALLILVCSIQTVTSGVLLSELNADSPGETDVMEFIELYNDGASPVNLDDYIIVLYDGDDNSAYAVIPLQGGTMSPYGYFVIGSENVVPQPDKLFDSNFDILENGVDAIALYRGNPSHYVVGMPVTNESLVDAVVYDKRGRSSSPLLDVLTPGGGILDEWGRHLRGGVDESLSRCRGMDPLTPSQFQLTVLTPGALNNCTIQAEVTTAAPPTMPDSFPNLPSFPPDMGDIYPDIVINEFSLESGQFIELYDGGVGGMILDGLFLVLYRGRTEASYGQPIILAGYTTDEKGYFLIGERSLQPDLELPRTLRSNRPPNAIALHFGEVSNFAPLTPVTGDNLVDAVVYGDTPDPNALVNVLFPGDLPLIQQGNRANSSFSRCRSSERLTLAAFTTAAQTPGGDNLCSLPNLVINEVNIVAQGDPTHQFIEVFDGGVGLQPLDGIVVVLYRGKKSYLAIDLTGYSTNAHGFCVVGWINGTGVDVGVNFDPTVGFLRQNPGAVALHLGSSLRFRSGSSATNYNLIDAVVYGEEATLDLLHTLMPYQHVLNELGGSTSSGDQSISRCSCCQKLSSSSFGVGPSTPGAINVDCLQNNLTHIETLDHYIDLIRINEIRIVQAGLPRGDFVEIYDGGFGGSGIPLTNMVLVLYSSQGESCYKTVDLDGMHTDANGFFVIGPRSVKPTVALVEDNHWFQGGSGAVAIHKGSPADFPVGTRASTIDLVDAVVFGDNNLLLLDLLTPGQSYVNYSTAVDETSILRCYSRDAFDAIAFSVSASSPGATNVCPPPPIVFNEVNILDVSEGVGQYIELSSSGIPRFPLNDLLLLFWKGAITNPVSYRLIAINGRRTNKDGLFLIGYRGLSSPRPDMTSFSIPTGKIKAGSNAISLHHGLRVEDYPKKSPLTTAGLVDVIVYGTEDSEISQHLIDFFQPRFRLQINEESAWSERDESINRCLDSENNTVYMLAHITPKAHNHCPVRPDASLVINELNLIPSEQFIELWDLGAGFTSLDDFVVVLFGEGDTSYWSIPLTGFTTDTMGYFLMGTTSILPPAHFQFAHGFMRNTYGAVAVYRVSSATTSFPDGASPSSQGLVDAVVYTDQDSNPTGLTDVLTPRAVDSRDLQVSGFSLSRCLSSALRSRKPFVVRPQTPRSFNDCPVYASDVVINEVNTEHPGQSSQMEFIELYDGGVGNLKMTYLSLVMFTSNNGDHAYLTVSLHNKRTDENGYFVIGGQDIEGANLVLRTRFSGGFLQGGPGAIALYRAPTGAFPYGAEATTKSLVDTVVYSTDERDYISLVDKLISGQSAVVEDANHATGDETINRCHGDQRLSTDAFTMGWPTPGQVNNCSRKPVEVYQDILINEVNVEAIQGGGDFIELSNKGVGVSSLTGFLLVLFNGANQDRSYLEIDLAGYSTNTEGFFVVGTSSVRPTPDIIVRDNFLQDGPDAVVLYHTQARLFPRGTIATSTNLVDVIVYGTGSAAGDGSTLLARLAPGQRSATEYATYLEGDESLSRCLSNQSSSLSSFMVSQPTPGQPNSCSGTPVVISEIKLAGDTVGFIELYDGGRGSTSLDLLSVTLYDSEDNSVYFHQALTGKSTNRNGYFVMGKPSSTWTVDLEVGSSSSSFLRNGGSSAVALYRDDVRGSSTYQRVLIDALVYGSRNPPNVPIIRALMPGQAQVQVSPGFSSGDAGISRCTCCVPLTNAAFALTPPTPGRGNGCLVGTTVATPTDIIINEISPWTGAAECKEYIELRGPPETSLQALTLVLSSSTKNGPANYFALQLDQQAISSDGIFVVGSANVTPAPDVVLPQSLCAVIRPGEGAVAIYRNVLSQFGEGSPVTSTDLVDAVVYTNLTTLSAQLSSILTPGFDSIFTGNFSPIADVTTPSISRCDCCDSQNPSSFTLSAQTPGLANRCPSRKYRRTIQLHILDAAYEVWVTNPRLTGELREQIAAGVNALCKCGFNVNYLRDEKLLNGSVFYQADMYALSRSHAKLLYDSYVSFVRKTPTVKVMGTEFHIDNKCFSDCLSGPSKPGGQTGAQGGSAAVTVAVVVVVIVIGALIAGLLYIMRHRRGSLSFGKDGKRGVVDMEGEFRVSHNCSLGDLDILGKVTDCSFPPESFSNPVYQQDTPVPQPDSPTKAGQHEGTDTKKAEEGSTQAKAASAAISNGVQSV